MHSSLSVTGSPLKFVSRVNWMLRLYKRFNVKREKYAWYSEKFFTLENKCLRLANEFIPSGLISVLLILNLHHLHAFSINLYDTIFYHPVCVCVYKCACVYFSCPWRYIIFSQPPFFRCCSSSDNQWCSSFSGLSCGPSSSDQGPSSAEDNPMQRLQMHPNIGLTDDQLSGSPLSPF